MLLQVYCLKEQNNQAWTTVELWMSKLFPKLPSNRCRALVEKALRGVLLLEKSEIEKRQEYYAQIHDLEFVGHVARDCGLTRSNLLDLTTVPKLDTKQLSNGLLLELNDFCVKEKLDSVYLETIIEYTFPQVDGQMRATLKKKTSHVKKTFAKLNKSKSKNSKAQEFLNCLCFENSPPANTCTGSSSSTLHLQTPQHRQNPVSSGPSSSALQTPQHGQIPVSSGASEKRQVESLQAKCEKMKKTIEQLNSDLENVKESTVAEIKILKEVCRAKENIICQLEKTSHQQNNTLKKQEQQLTSLNEELTKTKKSLCDCKDELQTVKGSGKYQQLRRQSIKLEKMKKNNREERGHV